MASRCSTLQHTAAHCNTLQHTATHCSVPQHTTAHCSTLQHVAEHCNILQHTATNCNTLQHTHRIWEVCSLRHSATQRNTPQHTLTELLGEAPTPQIALLPLLRCKRNPLPCTATHCSTHSPICWGSHPRQKTFPCRCSVATATPRSTSSFRDGGVLVVRGGVLAYPINRTPN